MRKTPGRILKRYVDVHGELLRSLLEVEQALMRLDTPRLLVRAEQHGALVVGPRARMSERTQLLMLRTQLLDQLAEERREQRRALRERRN